jgi:alkylhydroperoxidase/carboxymuconolactone decarboxylase family protein YurZ
VIPYPQGIRYESNGPRAHGIKKSEIADIIALGWISAGPFGINAAAAALYDFMKEWDDSDAPGWAWPEGWAHDPDAFSSGIDFLNATDDNTIEDDDLERLVEWHRRVEGDVPSYVPFLAKHYPLALKAFRNRMEATLSRGSLPKQYVALCWVHLAASWWRPEALRRAIHMARVFGVTKDQVVHVIALTQVYQGHVGMDAVIGAVGDSLDGWD